MKPYSHKKGYCDICGSLLNPETFWQLGTCTYCSRDCAEKDYIGNVSAGNNHADIIPVYRDEMRDVVAKIKMSGNKRSVIFSEHETNQWNKNNFKESTTVPDLSQEFENINSKMAKSLSGMNICAQPIETIDRPDLEILSVDELLTKFLDNEAQLKELNKYRQEIESQRDTLEEPEVIESITEWTDFRTNKEQLEKLVTETLNNIEDDVKNIKAENKAIYSIIFYSEDIPNKKWIRMGDKGIFIREANHGGVEIRKWEEVLKLIEPTDQKTVTSIYKRATLISLLVLSIIGWFFVAKTLILFILGIVGISLIAYSFLSDQD